MPQTHDLDDILHYNHRFSMEYPQHVLVNGGELIISLSVGDAAEIEKLHQDVIWHINNSSGTDSQAQVSYDVIGTNLIKLKITR